MMMMSKLNWTIFKRELCLNIMVVEIPRAWYDTYIDYIDYMYDLAVEHGSTMRHDEFVAYAFKCSSGFM